MAQLCHILGGDNPGCDAGFCKRGGGVFPFAVVDAVFAL